MTPTEFVTTVLDPGAAWCEAVPGWHVPFDVRARVLLTAIPGQESAWSDRIQKGRGPAHSLYQFERLGGIQGVLTHSATKDLAHKICTAASVPADATHVWGIMATPAGDNLSVAFARLLLWSDPHFLPPFGNEEAGWIYYVRNWRPGAVAAGGDRATKARERWATVYRQAMDAILPEKKA